MTVKWIPRATILALWVLSGCAPAPTGSSDSMRPLYSIDGLRRVEIAVPGVLELRENHGIGSYDALMLPPANLRYRQDSQRLTYDAREIFLSVLHQTLVDATKAASIPIVSEPGPCVMEIEFDVVRMFIDVSERSKQIADLILVMQFRDSASGDILLRYATRNQIATGGPDIPNRDQLRKGLVQIMRNMDLSGPLRGAGLADDEISPECKGTLAAIGRAAQRKRLQE
ncbi:MAG: hypothetical protein IPK00_20705 [Deltaproteobacteria bacterium]|nr:hypothetical protein [Deltaproteobacteria bacterium]